MSRIQCGLGRERTKERGSRVGQVESKLPWERGLHPGQGMKLLVRASQGEPGAPGQCSRAANA